MNVVLSTCSPTEARTIARQIVEERLAACCNLVPQVESVYWWEGKLTSDTEVLMIFKTPAEGVPDLMRRLSEIHPYETPEILALDVAAALPSYSDWVVRETRRPGENR